MAISHAATKALIGAFLRKTPSPPFTVHGVNQFGEAVIEQIDPSKPFPLPVKFVIARRGNANGEASKPD